MITVNQSFLVKRTFRKGKFTAKLVRLLGKGERAFVYFNGMLQTRGSSHDYTLKGRTLRMLWALGKGDRIEVLFL